MTHTGKRTESSPAITVLLAVVLALGCAGGLVAGCSREEGRPGGREKVSIATPALPYSLLVAVARERRLFEAEGLDVTVIPFGYGKEALEAVISGKTDLGLAADTALVFAILKGEEVSTLAEVCSSRHDLGVIARRDRNISKPGDLRGRRIGITPGTVGEFFLDSLLTLNGLERGEIGTVPLKPHQMLRAIRSGEVDAVAVWNPQLSEIRKALGEKGITFFEETAHPFMMLLIGTKEFVRRSPGTATKVLRALLAAEAFVRANPGEAARMVSTATGMEQKYLTERWPDFTFAVTLDQALVINLEDQARWAMRNGLTSARTMPNFLDSIDVTPLTRVRPGAVTLIQ